MGNSCSGDSLEKPEGNIKTLKPVTDPQNTNLVSTNQIEIQGPSSDSDIEDVKNAGIRQQLPTLYESEKETDSDDENYVYEFIYFN